VFKMLKIIFNKNAKPVTQRCLLPLFRNVSVWGLNLALNYFRRHWYLLIYIAYNNISHTQGTTIGRWLLYAEYGIIRQQLVF
jgi:hypothetical protein